MKIKALLYCCKEKNRGDRLVRDEHYGNPFWLYGAITYNYESLNGKIACECEVETEELTPIGRDMFITETLDCFEILRHSCLKIEELSDYLYNSYKDSKGYALHTSNVKERVMELSDVFSIKDTGGFIVTKPIQKAPQNMQWCWVYENGKWVKYLLISIRPQWLCKILNGEKDIEVRRKVLKGVCE